MSTPITKKKFLIGHNLNICHGLASSADYAEKIGATFYQIFLGSPMTYAANCHSDNEYKKLKKNLQTKNLKTVVHANYMLNFCNPPLSYKHTAAVKLLINDLKDSVKFNAVGVIIHMGKKLTMPADQAVQNYVKGVKTVLKNSPPESTVILETGAGVGTEVCTSIVDLGQLRKKFTKEERKRIKFCIDTCHVYSAGYNLGCPKYVTEVFDDLVSLHLGWKNVVCVHLNDSKTCLESKKDRHADITKGYIGEEGLKSFVQLCCSKKNPVPIVLETPCEDMFTREQQISLVRSWCDQ